ncbi:uncharacterized protein LOC123536219 [Mercenaria mercenaria]|uniref:uncharacterized protein LOC123536219 n=1 Tax=Mercenaria mercenaria TaxID=6596 RepID=UPI00234EF205|nr:uncharacterized protein LOC123536219 [Mercenaria mercenaria]
MSYIPLECNVCCKKFSGPISARDHFSSRDHNKKMDARKQDRPGFACDVCNITCDTRRILEQHFQSPRHNAMAEKQRNFHHYGNEILTDSNYAELADGRGDAYWFSSSSNQGKCNLCNVVFNSSSHAQSHLSGKAHKKKNAQFEAMKGSNVRYYDQPRVVQTTYQSQGSHNEFPRSQLHTLPPDHTGDHSAVRASNHDSNNMNCCDICGVSFSGHLNAQQHYASDKHKKKANQGLGNKPEYSCSLCNVTFTGPENEECHKLSQKHKKNVILMEKKAKGEELPLSCNACNCTFTGQENAEAHFQSKKHRRNMENRNIQSKAMHRENDNFVRANSTGPPPVLTSEIQVVTNEKEMPRLIKPLAKRPDEAPVHTNIAFTQYIRDTNDSSKDGVNLYHSNQYIKSENDDEEESDDELLAKPVEEENTNMRKISLEEDLVVKPIENDEDSLVIKPVDTDYGAQYRENDAESLDNESTETDPTPFDSMRSEAKIKAEIYTSLEQSLDTLSLSTGDFSSRDTEPVKYVKNDLRSSLTPFGRGRGIFTMLKQQDEKLPGKVVNTNKLNNVNPEDIDVPDESETWRKSVWSGTRAAPKSEFLPNGDDIEESGRHQYNIPLQSAEGNVNSRVSNSPPQVIYQRHDVSRPLSRESDGQYEMEEYVFDPVTGRGKCYICDIDFTSSKHKSQHILGKNHLKAREVHKEMSTQRGLANNSLFCEICSVTFSGPEAKEQHMKSEKHKKKERRHLTGEDNDYFCEICKISCTGPESFTQHQMGAQHRKLAGISPTDESGLPSPIYDRTKWYQCEVCKCSMNTYEQLKFHERSPKHMKQLEKQQLSGGTSTNDRTVWYPCHICNCKMNTQEQLRKHEASPAHMSKLRQSGGITQTDPSFKQFNQMPGHKVSSGSATPLESFLSEELFPEEFLPPSDSTSTKHENTPLVNDFQEQLVMTDKPLYLPPRFAIITEDQPGNEASANAPGTGGTKRGQGSELAYATRNRGEKVSHSNTGSSANSAAEDYASQGAKPKQGASLATGDSPSSSLFANLSNKNPTMDNPYAATHPYYCHTCKSPMNTRESYENHLRGKRHMQKVCTEPAPPRVHHMPLRLPDDYLPFTHTSPRNYQQELYKKAMDDNTLCFLPTGTGKTLVAVMTISAMLDKCRSKNVLFLVDKVLLVIQQSKYIRTELGDREFNRFNPDSDTLQRRTLRIAAVCMGQQTTNGIPLWKHDIVVVTAAFCQNLLDKQILRWEDFSLVVFDEAHHCEKGHPFNALLSNYHRRTPTENKPKILGLTASPAGKADVPKTLQMLQGLVSNMGDVRMTIVEEHENVDTLNEYQSNADMIIRPQLAPSGLMESTLKHVMNEYIMHCILKLSQISNINYYIDFERRFNTNMPDEEVRRVADDFVDSNIDMIQSSLNMIENVNESIGKVQFSNLCMHIQSVCMALNCLEEGGILIALQEMEDIETEGHNFKFAREFGLPTAHLQQIIARQGQCLDGQLGGSNGNASGDLHMKRLIDELTDGGSLRNDSDRRSISLVLVKQRCTAHLITKMLQKSERMRQLGLNTTCVVGHGGSGAADKGMNVNQQKRVLEEIKQYKYQVIVATSVAEEGVDWPECERVISLYPPSTVTALVQMRGRARRKNSKFIVLCGSQEEEGKLYDIMQREKNMIAATRLLIEQNRNTEY